jgi:hypothetical protein
VNLIVGMDAEVYRPYMGRRTENWWVISLLSWLSRAGFHDDLVLDGTHSRHAGVHCLLS